MSKIKLTGHASGSGVLTIAAPNTDSDRTITLPDVTGTLLDSGSDLPAANLTGTVADARISAVTASKLTGALPALDGSALTGVGVAGITSSADATAITIDSSERVGIGTTSMEANLHIKKGDSGASVHPSTALYIENSGDTILQIGSPNNAEGRIFFTDPEDNNVGQISYGHSDNHMRFRTNDSEAMRIDSSGNVGIGRTPEAWKSSMTALALGQSNAIYARSDNQAITLAKNFYHNSSSQDIAIVTDQAAKLELNSGQIKFFTAGTTSSGSAISWNEALTIHDNGRSAFAKRIAIDGSGFSEMAITARCDSDSSKTWRGFSNTGNTHTYMINNNNAGVYMPFGNTSWSSHSDERVKENIVALGTVLPELLNMRCVKYNRIGDSGSDRTKIGFIAQDWESTPFSEVVDEDTSLVIESDGTVSTDFTSESTTAIKSIAYTETIPVLLKAIQELEARLTTLEG